MSEQTEYVRQALLEPLQAAVAVMEAADEAGERTAMLETALAELTNRSEPLRREVTDLDRRVEEGKSALRQIHRDTETARAELRQATVQLKNDAATEKANLEADYLKRGLELERAHQERLAELSREMKEAEAKVAEVKDQLRALVDRAGVMAER
jgi:uncharacterized coiled-coil protein SlyX